MSSEGLNPSRSLRPYSAASEADEWIYTSAARAECEACGEWIYPRRHRDAPTAAVTFPDTCQVCGAPSPAEVRGG